MKSKRTSIVVADWNGVKIRVSGMYGNAQRLQSMIVDRIANEESFDGEQVFRLPRRLSIGPFGNIQSA